MKNERSRPMSATDREEKLEILKLRARELARELGDSATDEDAIEVLEFVLGQESYAVETSYVAEVYPLKDLTSVPCAPSIVVGVLNLRGEILSVMDIKELFGLPEEGLRERDRVIVTHHGAMRVGILADAVRGVHSIPLDEIQPPLRTSSGIAARYLRGITRDQVNILDIAKVISDKRMIVHEEVQS